MNQVDEVNPEPLEAVNNANLSQLPRDLAALWREYQHGLYGMKPARLFTTKERNNKKLKQKYYWRNQIWQIMVKQSRRRLTPEQAANEIIWFMTSWPQLPKSGTKRPKVSILISLCRKLIEY